MSKDKILKVVTKVNEFLGKPRGVIKLSIGSICSYFVVFFSIIEIMLGGKGVPILAILSLLCIFFDHSSSNRKLEELKEDNKVV
jgi:hypothetical protein